MKLSHSPFFSSIFTEKKAITPKNSTDRNRLTFFINSLRRYIDAPFLPRQNAVKKSRVQCDLFIFKRCKNTPFQTCGIKETFFSRRKRNKKLFLRTNFRRYDFYPRLRIPGAANVILSVHTLPLIPSAGFFENAPLARLDSRPHTLPLHDKPAIRQPCAAVSWEERPPITPHQFR